MDLNPTFLRSVDIFAIKKFPDNKINSLIPKIIPG